MTVLETLEPRIVPFQPALASVGQCWQLAPGASAVLLEFDTGTGRAWVHGAAAGLSWFERLWQSSRQDREEDAVRGLAFFDDICELKDRERAGGGVRLKPTRRRITLRRPPRPSGPPRP